MVAVVTRTMSSSSANGKADVRLKASIVAVQKTNLPSCASRSEMLLVRLFDTKLVKPGRIDCGQRSPKTLSAKKPFEREDMNMRRQRLVGL